jgi:hypothetical protein
MPAPAGYTATAFELGGEADVALDEAGRLRLRVGGSDLMVRYGLHAFRRNGSITDGFISHNLPDDRRGGMAVLGHVVSPVRT